jgi:hypothetical protein
MIGTGKEASYSEKIGTEPGNYCLHKPKPQINNVSEYLFTVVLSGKGAIGLDIVKYMQTHRWTPLQSKQKTLPKLTLAH